MAENQKERHVKEFFSAPLAVCGQQNDTSHMKSPPNTPANYPLTNPLVQLQLPSYVTDKIWSEADNLLKDGAKNVCLSPGCTSGLEFLVKSFEDKHKHPYFVECRASGQIVCEKCCALYSSCKVCSHTVTVARHTDSIGRYLQWLLKQRSGINLTAMADLHMPKGAGKKPCSHRKASQKSSTKRIKVMLSQTDANELTPRIKPKPVLPMCEEKPTCTTTPILPGPSGLCYPHPPALIPAGEISLSPDLLTYVKQPSHPPPPLVSTGTLMQHICLILPVRV